MAQKIVTASVKTTRKTMHHKDTNLQSSANPERPLSAFERQLDKRSLGAVLEDVIDVFQRGTPDGRRALTGYILILRRRLCEELAEKGSVI